MEQEIAYRKRIVEEYRAKITPLTRYLPWLTQKQGERASSVYDEDGLGQHSVAVPVYDSNLLSFIKEAQKSGLVDRNYFYVYSRNHIKTSRDELQVISKATLQEMPVLTGILSKYVLGGMTKSILWSQGVENGVLLAVVSKMKEIVEYWDKPLA